MSKSCHKAKEHGVQWQLNRSYHFTCTPSRETAAMATTNTVVRGKFQAACISKITVELTSYFLALHS